MIYQEVKGKTHTSHGAVDDAEIVVQIHQCTSDLGELRWCEMRSPGRTSKDTHQRSPRSIGLLGEKVHDVVVCYGRDAKSNLASCVERPTERQDMRMFGALPD